MVITEETNNFLEKRRCRFTEQVWFVCWASMVPAKPTLDEVANPPSMSFPESFRQSL